MLSNVNSVSWMLATIISERREADLAVFMLRKVLRSSRSNRVNSPIGLVDVQKIWGKKREVSKRYYVKIHKSCEEVVKIDSMK